MLLSLHPVTPEARHMRRALEVFEKGGICVYPTDSGYSLGCDARNRVAVNKLYHLKRAIKKYVMALMVRDLMVERLQTAQAAAQQAAAQQAADAVNGDREKEE